MYSGDTLRSTDDGATYCIACGEVLPRSEACEYDKHGERLDREDTHSESLCKHCHQEYSQVPRGNLESLLVEAGAGTTDDATFLRRYIELVQEQ
jgi:hypothetical protein